MASNCSQRPATSRAGAPRGLLPRPRRRRTVQLLAGLVLYGLSLAMLVEAGVGLDPWNVLHEGLSSRTPLSFGIIVNLVGATVLLLWIPLRQRPGVGTVANVVVVGIAADVFLWLLPEPSGWLLRGLTMIVGVVMTGLATGMYLGAGLGPGARDGLMTGLAARTGLSLRVVRTGIELTVLAVGWLLGGTVGVGTVVFALAIGPLAQAFLGVLAIDRAARPPLGESGQLSTTWPGESGKVDSSASPEG